MSMMHDLDTIRAMEGATSPAALALFDLIETERRLLESERRAAAAFADLMTAANIARGGRWV